MGAEKRFKGSNAVRIGLIVVGGNERESALAARAFFLIVFSVFFPFFSSKYF